MVKRHIRGLVGLGIIAAFLDGAGCASSSFDETYGDTVSASSGIDAGTVVGQGQHFSREHGACSTVATGTDTTTTFSTTLSCDRGQRLHGRSPDGRVWQDCWSGRLSLSEVLTVNDAAKTVNQIVTVSFGAEEIFAQTSSATSDTVSVNIDYGPVFHGIRQASFSDNGHTITGNIDGRSIVPLDAPSAPLGLRYSDLHFADHHPPPDVHVDDDLDLAIAEAFAQASDELPLACSFANARPEHKSAPQGVNPGPIVFDMGTGPLLANADNPNFQQGCDDCLHPCNKNVAICYVVAAGGCSVVNILDFELLDAACIAGAYAGCFAVWDVCVSTCEDPGGMCCPLQCQSGGVFVGGCCNGDDSCATTTEGSNTCCGPRSAICNGDCCDPSILDCNQGTCCPANTNPCGSTCCTNGDVCTDGVCCPPGIAACAGSCCGSTDQACEQPGNVCCSQALCGGFCCAPGRCVNGACCDGAVASNGTCCPNVLDVVCPNDGTCCDGSCVNGSCCPGGRDACGSVCCAAGSACTDAATSTCSACASGEVPVHDPETDTNMCCPSGDALACNGACCGAGLDSCCPAVNQGPAVCTSNCFIP